MKSLELECSECGDKINIEMGEEEFEYYQTTGSLIEDSDAYHNLFDKFGWVLQQAPFCDMCKYECSEIYQES